MTASKIVCLYQISPFYTRSSLLLLSLNLSFFVTGRAHSTPLPTFLRIPLAWNQSITYSFYANEPHSSIRRVFSPRHAPYTKHYFCGFCGTPLSYWSEESEEEAEWLRVSLGSLDGRSLGVLGDVGILPPGAISPPDEEAEPGASAATKTAVIAKEGDREIRGEPWFEEIIEGSELGRIRRRRGGRESRDGRVKVEWEVVDFGGEDAEEGAGNGKRKIGEVAGESEDVAMKGGH